jgi:hypothetical protein
VQCGARPRSHRVDVEPAPVVANLASERLAVVGQRDGDRPRPGVLADVRERLLCGSVDELLDGQVVALRFSGDVGLPRAGVITATMSRSPPTSTPWMSMSARTRPRGLELALLVMAAAPLREPRDEPVKPVAVADPEIRCRSAEQRLARLPDQLAEAVVHVDQRGVAHPRDHDRLPGLGHVRGSAPAGDRDELASVRADGENHPMDPDRS